MQQLLRLWKTKPDYDFIIKRLHLYYDMKLVTFGIDKDKNLIVQFHTAIYTSTPDITPDRNSTSDNHSSKYTSAILHTYAGK